MDRVLLIFADGVGLAPAADDNPLARVPTPALSGLLGGLLVRETAETPPGGAHGAVLVPLDANLGVEGLPQSATGQTTLFTGVNAAAHLGRHVSAFPGPRLKALIETHGLLRRGREAGLDVTFANPYTRGYFERVAARRGRHSATTVTAMTAGLRLRDVGDLTRGEAVAWDIVRDRFGAGRAGAPPPVAPEEAGRHLAALAGGHRLTLWETFYTDLAGHRRFDLSPDEAVRRLDGLLAGVLAHRPPELTVLLTSDHGNLEEASHTVHTRNPVPLLAVGPLAECFRPLASLTEVTPAVLGVLGAS